MASSARTSSTSPCKRRRRKNCKTSRSIRCGECSVWKCINRRLRNANARSPFRRRSITAVASTTVIKLLVAFLALLAKDVGGGHPRFDGGTAFQPSDQLLHRGSLRIPLDLLQE